MPAVGRLVQAHDRAGVADEVVVVAVDVVGRRRTRTARCRRGAGCGRTTDRGVADASSDAAVGCGQCSGGASAPKASDAGDERARRRRTARAASGRRCGSAVARRACGVPASSTAACVGAGRSNVGSANHAVSGSRLSTKRPRRRPRSTTAVAVDDRRAALPGGPSSMRNRASQSRPRGAVAERAMAADVGSTTSTRSRVDGTAQITSAATARYENTSTSADSSIATWKQTATHTAA